MSAGTTPILRVLGAAALRAEQGLYDLIHVLRLHFQQTSLEIYVEANGEEEEVLVASSARAEA